MIVRGGTDQRRAGDMFVRILQNHIFRARHEGRLSHSSQCACFATSTVAQGLSFCALGSSTCMSMSLQ